MDEEGELGEGVWKRRRVDGLFMGRWEVRGCAVKVVDLGDEVVVPLSFCTRDTVFDEADDGGRLHDRLNMTRTNDEALAVREEADDRVIALMTNDVA